MVLVGPKCLKLKPLLLKQVDKLSQGFVFWQTLFTVIWDRHSSCMKVMQVWEFLVLKSDTERVCLHTKDFFFSLTNFVIFIRIYCILTNSFPFWICQFSLSWYFCQYYQLCSLFNDETANRTSEYYKYFSLLFPSPKLFISYHS